MTTIMQDKEGFYVASSGGWNGVGGTREKALEDLVLILTDRMEREKQQNDVLRKKLKMMRTSLKSAEATVGAAHEMLMMWGDGE